MGEIKKAVLDLLKRYILGLIKNEIKYFKDEIGESLLKPMIVNNNIGKDNVEKINIFKEKNILIFLRIK